MGALPPFAGLGGGTAPPPVYALGTLQSVDAEYTVLTRYSRSRVTELN